MSLTKKEIQLFDVDAVDKNGEVYESMKINHIEHGKHKLLHKKVQGGDQRVSRDAMKAIMKEQTNWRDNIVFVAEGKYGPYFSLDTSLPTTEVEVDM